MTTARTWHAAHIIKEGLRCMQVAMRDFPHLQCSYREIKDRLRSSRIDRQRFIEETSKHWAFQAMKKSGMI